MYIYQKSNKRCQIFNVFGPFFRLRNNLNVILVIAEWVNAEGCYNT